MPQTVKGPEVFGEFSRFSYTVNGPSDLNSLAPATAREYVYPLVDVLLISESRTSGSRL